MNGSRGSAVFGTADLLSTSIGKVIFPVWTPDGSSLLVAVRGNGLRQEIQGVRLLPARRNLIVEGANCCGRARYRATGVRCYTSRAPVGATTYLVVELGTNRTPRPVLATPANETHPALSADGKWLLYGSDDYLYVRPFSGPGRETRITRTQATAAMWAADGRSVLFLDNSGEPPESCVCRSTRVVIGWSSEIPRGSRAADSVGQPPWAGSMSHQTAGGCWSRFVPSHRRRATRGPRRCSSSCTPIYRVACDARLRVSVRGGGLGRGVSHVERSLRCSASC